MLRFPNSWHEGRIGSNDWKFIQRAARSVRPPLDAKWLGLADGERDVGGEGAHVGCGYLEIEKHTSSWHVIFLHNLKDIEQNIIGSIIIKRWISPLNVHLATCTASSSIKWSCRCSHMLRHLEILPSFQIWGPAQSISWAFLLVAGGWVIDDWAGWTHGQKQWLVVQLSKINKQKPYWWLGRVSLVVISKAFQNSTYCPFHAAAAVSKPWEAPIPAPVETISRNGHARASKPQRKLRWPWFLQHGAGHEGVEKFDTVWREIIDLDMFCYFLWCFFVL